MDSTRSKVTKSSLGLGLLAIIAAGCNAGSDGGLPTGTSEEGPKAGGQISGTAQKTVLDERVTSYGDALRTASLKLTDKLPTLQAVKSLAASKNPGGDYNAAIDHMVESNEFKRRMIRWARDTFRQGGGDLDSAPLLFARIVVEGRPLAELFTAASGNCPSYDDKAEKFVDGECKNNAPVQAGVLTNPGTMKQFYSSMAFRRVRWVQEIFACTKFPAEYAENPVDKGAGQFTSPWAFDSVATAPINFQDTSAVICANCHTSINHIAPLFANFDKSGMWKDSIQVMTPTAPDPQTTKLSHWLKDGEASAWRFGKPVKAVPDLVFQADGHGNGHRWVSSCVNVHSLPHPAIQYVRSAP